MGKTSYTQLSSAPLSRGIKEALTPHRKSSGFTLVEILIVVVIIAVLATLVIVSYRTIQARARDNTVVNDIAAVSDLETNYGIKNNSGGKAWFSGSGIDSSLNFTPTGANIIDVVTNSADYCIRAYNPASAKYKTLASAAIKESTPGVCTTLVASTVAQGGSTCPSGFLVVPGSATYGTSNFCVAKYDSKQASSTVPTSQAAGIPWVSISEVDSATYAKNVVGCNGCHLITNAEYLTIAQNVLMVPSNWTGGAVGSGEIYRGHTDGEPNTKLAADTDDTNGYYGETNTGGNQRRTLTLSTGDVIWDFVGNVNTWLSDVMPAHQQPGVPSRPIATWYEYNNPSLILNGFASYSLPSAAYSGASGWTHDQGIGMIYGDPNNTTVTSAYMRGCYYAADVDSSFGSHCGLFGIFFGNTTTATSIGEGFRITK